MERQQLTPGTRRGKTVLIRTRPRSSDLSPEELVSRLIHARKASGTKPSYADYCAARGGAPDISADLFSSLAATREGDPVFFFREHVFSPSFRDATGRTYELLDPPGQNNSGEEEEKPEEAEKIRLIRDDGVTGYTTLEELVSFFLPIGQKEKSQDIP